MGGVILRDTILGLTALAGGGVIWLAGTNLRAAWRYRDLAPLCYAVARTGFVITILLVAEVVAGVPELPITSRTIAYAIGLGMAVFGYAGVIVFESRRNTHSDVDRKVL